jgi:hypothetical protein
MASAVADKNGDFIFRLSSHGQFYIEASAPGFLNGASSELPSRGTTIDTKGLTTGEGVTLKLWKASAVTGMVSVEGGRPASRVRVNAVRVGSLRAGGSAVAASTNTADDGSYEFSDLAAGDYLIGVLSSFRTVNAGESSGHRLSNAGMLMRVGDAWLDYPAVRDGTPFAWMDMATLWVRPPAFYPSAAIGQAQVLSLRYGEVARGINFAWRAFRPGVIEGRVASTSGLAGGVMVRALPVDANSPEVSDEVLTSAFTTTDGSGSFSLLGLAAGTYRIVALETAAMSRSELYHSGIRWGSEIVTIDSSLRVESVELRLRDGIHIQGRVIGTSPGNPPEAMLRNMEISADAPGSPRMNPSSSARVSNDGSFVLGSLLPGKYHLAVSSLTRGWSVERVSVGSQILDSNFVDVPAQGMYDVQVRLADHPTSVSVTTEGRPFSDRQELIACVFPNDKRLWTYISTPSPRFRQTEANPAGVAAFDDLPTGSYLAVFVASSAMIGNWRSEASLEHLSQGATRFELRPGDRVSITARVYQR